MLIAWGELENAQKQALTGNWTQGLQLELTVLWLQISDIFYLYYML